jgi:hypothetical protein
VIKLRCTAEKKIGVWNCHTTCCWPQKTTISQIGRKWNSYHENLHFKKSPTPQQGPNERGNQSYWNFYKEFLILTSSPSAKLRTQGCGNWSKCN